jgi:sulfite reductase alpha subunit-like flavoprotein
MPPAPPSTATATAGFAPHSASASEQEAPLYRAGDVAVVFAENSREMVDRALKVLARAPENACFGAGATSCRNDSNGSSNSSNNNSSSGDSSDTRVRVTRMRDSDLPEVRVGTSSASTLRRDSPIPLGCRLPSLPRTRLRTLLHRCLDLSGAPPRTLFEGAAAYASDPDERDKLLEMSSAEGADLYFDFVLRARRGWVEVLEDFRSVALPLPALLALCPLLKPRQFSIASSAAAPVPAGLLEFECQPQSMATSAPTPAPAHTGIDTDTDTDTDTGTGSSSGHRVDVLLHQSAPRVDLCVGLVRHKTPWGHLRLGVCSSWLCAASPGHTRVRLWLRVGSFRTPKDPRAPLLLVGPGTGVAPMRAAMWERIAQQQQQQQQQQQLMQDDTQVGPTLLLYGCRRRDSDFLYRSEWPAVGLRPRTQASSEAAGPPTTPFLDKNKNTTSHFESALSSSSSNSRSSSSSRSNSESSACKRRTDSNGHEGPFDSSLEWATRASAWETGRVALHAAFSREESPQQSTSREPYWESGQSGSGPGSGPLINLAPALVPAPAPRYVTHGISGWWGEQVWGILSDDRAQVFVAGSANKMPRDVRESLLKCCISHGKLSESAAESLLKNMERTGRYYVEAWS